MNGGVWGSSQFLISYLSGPCRIFFVVLGALFSLISPVCVQSAERGRNLAAADFSELIQGPVLSIPSLELGEISSLNEASAGQVVGLDQLLRNALQMSPQLRQAQAVRESFEFQRKAARADLLPSLSVRVAGGREQSVPSVEPNNEFHSYGVNTVRLTQPIYNRYLQLEHAAAQHAEEGAGMRYRSVRENTMASVVRATLDVIAARLTLQFSDEQLRQLQDILGYLENRAAAGASSQADLERARTRAFNVRQTRVEQQAVYRNALFELERLTGKKPQALELPSRDQWLPVQIGRTALTEKAFALNADVQALQREVDTQRVRVAAEFARYRPVLGVSLEHDSSRNIQGSLGRRQDNRALLVMTWTGSLAGKEWHLAQAADAELRQREARLHDEKNLLAQAIEADYSLLESSLLRMNVARLEQQAASRVVEAVAEQLRTGRLTSLLEALDANDRLFGARQRLTQSVVQALRAHVQLLQRTGLLTEDAVKAVPASRS